VSRNYLHNCKKGQSCRAESHQQGRSSSLVTTFVFLKIIIIIKLVCTFIFFGGEYLSLFTTDSNTSKGEGEFWNEVSD